MKRNKVILTIGVIMALILTMVIIMVYTNKSNHKKIVQKDKKLTNTNVHNGNKKINTNKKILNENQNNKHSTSESSSNNKIKEHKHEWKEYGHNIVPPGEWEEVKNITEGKDIKYACGLCNNEIINSSGEYNINDFKNHMLYSCPLSLEKGIIIYDLNSGQSHINISNEELLSFFEIYNPNPPQIYIIDKYVCKICGTIKYPSN